MLIMAKTMKTFCFFCNYEIYNEKYRTVLYKNLTKKVCFFCTPSKHKACKLKFKGSKIDCRICEKPAKFNKCTRCYLCNHLIHAQCNNLAPKDLKHIEMYDSLICKLCTKSIFPFGTDYEEDTLVNIDVKHSKLKEIHNQNPYTQCFTCTNIIERRQKYTKKNIIYDGKKETLCKTCSIIGLDLPVRDINKLEFLNCSVCSHLVKYQGIICSKCNCWNHPECNNIDNINNIIDNINNTTL